MLMDAAVVEDVLTSIASLFGKVPMLAGFSVQDCADLPVDRNSTPLGPELCVADITFDAWPGWQAGPAVHAEIARTLLQLLNEHPESYEVLRGQTFARTFH